MLFDWISLHAISVSFTFVFEFVVTYSPDKRKYQSSTTAWVLYIASLSHPQTNARLRCTTSVSVPNIGGDVAFIARLSILSFYLSIVLIANIFSRTVHAIPVVPAFFGCQKTLPIECGISNLLRHSLTARS